MDILKNKSPAYLRLGQGKNSPFAKKKINFFDALILNKDSEITIVSSGPVLNNVLEAVSYTNLNKKIDLFSLTRLPYNKLPVEFIKSTERTNKILIIEEHIRTGGIAERISFDLLSDKIKITAFKSLYALGYPGNVYGSQNFQLKKSKLDSNSILREIKNLIM